jgi:hypothetical protein
MGTIHTRIDRDHDLTINTAEGPLVIDDIIAAVTDYLESDATTKVLWDFRHADGSAIQLDDLIQLQHIVRRKAAGKAKRKVALVVARDLGFGLSRMAGSQAEIAGIEVAYYVTRKLEDAMAWLGVPSSV